MKYFAISHSDSCNEYYIYYSASKCIELQLQVALSLYVTYVYNIEESKISFFSKVHESDLIC